MANRPFKIPKDTKGNEYFPVTTTDAIIYSDNGEKKVLTEVIKKDLKDLNSLIIDEENRVLKENERKAAEILRAGKEDIRKQNEEDRKANELTRQNSFSSNEAARQKTFNDNESARQNTFIKAESQRETAETIRQEEELKRQEAETIRQENYDKKVDRTDNAPELTSGFAGNLVGRGESTSEEIGFRPSGGLTSVNDGAARIERLKGNTLVWNQLYPTGWTLLEQGVRSVSSDGIISLNGTTTVYYFNLNNGEGVSSIPYGHKGLYHLDIIKDDSGYLQGKKIGLLNRYASAAIEGTSASFFYKNIDETSYWGFGFTGIATGDTITDVKIRVSIYDLTQMFGAGNEPTTIEEFNARKPLGIDEYAYNEGELISTTADEIKSVGFNAWDEEWSVGYIKDSDGADADTSDTKRLKSKNKIPVLPNVSYYLGIGDGSRIYYYDVTGAYIAESAASATRGVITTPSNAHYMRFMASQAYGTTYNHDICIHLVHTGYRNGEYEPYEEFRRSLPISEIKDSEGNALFPNGLLSAGSVYDEITATKAIKRIGMVDMGTLKDWGTITNIGFWVDIPDKKEASSSNKKISNLSCSKYSTGVKTYYSNTDEGDKCVCESLSAGSLTFIKVVDSTYTNNLAAFKAAMQGVMLYYELAEPIEVDLPEPLNLDYEVSDFGTEEVISDTPTTPLKADIIYQFNAVDRIRENSLSIGRLSALEQQAVVKNDIVNNLTDGGADKALSAEMGLKLKEIATDLTIIYALPVIYNSKPSPNIGNDGDYALFLFVNHNQRLYKKINGEWTIFTDYKKVIVIAGNRTFYRESNNEAQAFTEITTPIIDFELSLTGAPTSSTKVEGKHYIWYNESVPRAYAYTYANGAWKQINANAWMDNPIFRNGNDFYKFAYVDGSVGNSQLTKIIDNGLYDELTSKVEELESESKIEELAVTASGAMASTGASEKAFYLSVKPLTTYTLRFKAQYSGRLTLYASTNGSDNIGTILDAQQVDFTSEYETTITTPANCNVIRTRTYVVTTIDYISLYTLSTLGESVKDIKERVEAIEEKQKVQPNDWQGKVISFYGDSVTALNGGDFNYPYDESTFGYKWALRVANYFQASSVKSRGIGGQRFNWYNNGGSVAWVNTLTGEFVGRNDSYNYENYVGNVTIPSNCTPIRGALSSWLRIKSMYPESIKDTIDVVLVMAHNDMGFDAATEIQFVEGDNTDTEWASSSYYQTYGGDYNINTVKGGIASTIMKLQAWMPNAVIVLMTPISGRGEEGELNLELTSKMTEIADAVKDVHNLMSIPCIDVYGTCGINGLNRTRYITDTIHPYSEDGSKMVARAVIGGLKSIIPNML